MSDLKAISGLDNLGRCVDLVDLDPLDIVSSCKNLQAFFPKKDESLIKFVGRWEKDPLFSQVDDVDFFVIRNV